MNIDAGDAYTFVWQNVNYVNWKNNRIYFTSGEMVKMTEEEAAWLRESLGRANQGGQGGSPGTT